MYNGLSLLLNQSKRPKIGTVVGLWDVVVRHPEVAVVAPFLAPWVANEEHFHAKATKKAEGAKSSLNLIKNASKVANICVDVIGDICGVISGAIGTMIALKIASTYGVSTNIQFLISALIASITVGGKAIGKEIATNHSTKIVDRVGVVLSKFTSDK